MLKHLLDPCYISLTISIGYAMEYQTRFRFRLRHAVIALGMLALTYVVIRPSSETDNSTLKSLKG